jgi:hypothetical protein
MIVPSPVQSSGEANSLSSTKRKAATKTAIQISTSTMKTVSRLIRQHKPMAAISFIGL